MQCMFTQIGVLPNGRKDWGVRITTEEIGGAISFAEQKVQVRTRRGEVKDVDLGPMVSAWDGGRSASYAVRREESETAADGPNAAEALISIAQVLEAESWGSQQLDEVADILIAYGMPVTKP